LGQSRLFEHNVSCPLDPEERTRHGAAPPLTECRALYLSSAKRMNSRRDDLRPQRLAITVPRNIVEYIASRVWEDEQGRNLPIQDQRVFAARAVQKADTRPGGYVADRGTR
jgi:hypothetical protein